MDTAQRKEFIGAAAAIVERKVHIPAFWQVESIEDVEDVIRIMEAFHLAHAHYLEESLLYACLYLWLIEAPAMAVANECAPIPTMVYVCSSEITCLWVVFIRHDNACYVIFHITVTCLKEEVSVACLILQFVTLGWLQFAITILSYVAVHIYCSRVQLLEGWTCL